MTKYLCKIIFAIIFILIFIIIISKISYYNYKNTFLNPKFENRKNDGKMTFAYLTDKNYKDKLLKKYYINDDIKVNNRRVNTHWLQTKYKIYEGSVYGVPMNHVKSINNEWGKSRTFAEYIYAKYGIRR